MCENIHERLLLLIPRLSFVPLLSQKPTFVVEWLTLLLHIQEVLGSNLGPETCCRDSFLVVFPQPFDIFAGIGPQNEVTTTS
jgi:hypothetical protein